MPPQNTFNKNDLIAAGIKIIREKGSGAVSARNIAAAIKGSTQPVYSFFGNIENFRNELVKEAYQLALTYMLGFQDTHDKFLSIGLGFISFALNEPGLYDFIFNENIQFTERIKDDLTHPLLERMDEEPHLTHLNRDIKQRFLDYMTSFSRGLVIELRTIDKEKALSIAKEKMDYLGFALIAFETMKINWGEEKIKETFI